MTVEWHKWVTVLAAVALFAGPARGASFDCAKAASPIEKLICGDPALSSADEALATAWRDGLAATLDRPALREDQRQWQRNRGTVAADLLTSYRNRIDQLNAATGKWRALPRVFAPDKLNTTCFVTPDADANQTCRVEESGKVEGDDKLFYQLQGFRDGDLWTDGGAAVFAADPAGLVPVLTAHGDAAHYDRPATPRSPAGTLLWIPGHMEGTGNFNAERLYFSHDGSWEDIDTTSWQDDMARRLPHGLYAAKGIYPDYRKMTAATPLWGPTDGNCCPSGGRATFRLGLKDRRLSLEDIRITLGRAAAERE